MACVPSQTRWLLSEVGDLGVALVVDDHVVRLEVAVDDSVAVGEPGRLEDLDAQVDRAVLVERRLGGDDLLERAPREVLHRDVVGAVVLAAVEDAHDVRVLEPGRRTRLAPEALDELLVLREPAVEHLERHLAAEVGVLGAVDVRHPARADPADDAVARVDQRVVGDLGHPPPPSSASSTLLRDRRRHRAALRTGRLALDRHRDRDPRVLDRGERDEPWLGELAVGAHLGRSRLARDLDAGERRRRARALLDHARHHLPELRRPPPA